MSKHGSRQARDVDSDEDEPASRAQLQYLRQLLAKIKARGDEPPIEAAQIDDLNFEEADELIGEIKSWLHA